jgi:NADPH2:quinone reductase
MKAFGFTSDSSPAVLFEQATPAANGHDLLIKIEAIAVNPVDTKIKAKITQHLVEPKIVGWDAVGTVISVGQKVSLFSEGDKVFYAGDVTRPGCYASHQLVDERIVGHAPKTLTAEQAAALPLTSITAWEALFSRLKISQAQDAGKNILIIGGAGGVGSIAIQLAKSIAKLNVIATASRTESEQWCTQLGADHVINHHSNMALQYREIGIADPDYILCLNNTDQYFSAMAELIAPQGMICSIVETQQKHDIDVLKSKSAGFVWEFMFTRAMYQTADIVKQHELLNKIAQLVDSGEIISTHKQTLGAISSENISIAHQQLASGSTLGKITLTAIE